jgi:hypothetical protein
VLITASLITASLITASLITASLITASLALDLRVRQCRSRMHRLSSPLRA